MFKDRYVVESFVREFSLIKQVSDSQTEDLDLSLLISEWNNGYKSLPPAVMEPLEGQFLTVQNSSIYAIHIWFQQWLFKHTSC